jgi:glycosyltransferase involved in cell wall biosynthesis
MTIDTAPPETQDARRIRPRILLRVDEALRSPVRSGIHRVIVQIARALPDHAETHLVRWDRLAGHLRPIDRQEFDLLFGPTDWPPGLTPNPAARRVGYRFDTLVPCDEDTWLLNPDVPIHEPDGVEILARAITQCREYGAGVASIFYDLIPATNPAYAGDRAAYLSYLCEIARSDLVLPISRYSADALREFWGRVDTRLADTSIVVAPLAETAPHHDRPVIADGAGRTKIVLIGAVEPRKRQTEFLRAYAAARKTSPALAALEVCVVGSLHPAVAREFGQLVRQTPNVRYLDHAPDAEIADLMRHAAFTAFVSDDEGFGLPITESLAAGVPCLCASFGAMAEVAEGGGCLTVDVRDQVALEAALRRLAEDDALRARLRREIDARPSRTWADYAGALVTALLQARAVPPADGGVIVDVDGLDPFREADLLALAQADVVTAPDQAAADRFIQGAAEAEIDLLLPSRWIVDDPARAQAAGRRLAAHRQRLERIGRIEHRYAAARTSLAAQVAPRPVFLRIVVSTYNRRAFVVENVGWLLRALKNQRDVELVVVDNASTDGTVEALRRAHGARLNLIVNTANVGMLGNIRTCSQLAGAEYVWVIGDDDFVAPDQIGAVVAGLKANLGVPLAALNFAVYHRERLGPADHGAALIAGRTPLAPRAIDSGAHAVRTIAAQHDNLFTAIYGVIWRQDVLAAAYDHPFSGKPFDSLVEAIPCTKTILESFAAAPAYWHHPVAIVGNAHNSWTRHRPRWHGRLMAEAIGLARDAGVDLAILWPWARLQADLYEEAFAIARQEGFSPRMEQADYDLAWPLFRRRLSGSEPS